MKKTVIKKELMLLLFFSILLTVTSPLIQSQKQSTETSERNQSGQVELLVYTAIQEWPSKSWIYLLSLDGTPITCYSYDWYIFNDVEVVNNEVYVTDWVAPRLYKVNISTGELSVIIDDWSLLYMYDVAFDGNYFYIDEWSLNRYTLNGVKDSSISFNYNVRGSAWDGTFYWTLTDTTEIKCWNISAWPTILEVPQNNFLPPTPACRGLWFDGTYFWTAESLEGTPGYIYQFDYTGGVINQISEPSSKGYAACIVTMANDPPQKPEPPQGPTQGNQQVSYHFNTSTIDPDGHDLYYQWDWDDGPLSGWLGPYPSGIVIQQAHLWEQPGSYEIRVRAKDTYGSISTWSDSRTILIGNQPPTQPAIQGTLKGKPGVVYLYKFSSIDPEADLVFYYIDWGDGTSSEWIGPFTSGTQIEVSHQWNEQGTYLLKAKAKDAHGYESDWGILEITMPTKNDKTVRVWFRTSLLEMYFCNCFSLVGIFYRFSQSAVGSRYFYKLSSLK